MDKSNFVRKIDELGRIVLPIELRKILDINEKDSLEIYLTDGGIFLRKEKPSCVFCNSTVDLKWFYSKNICKNCIKNLK